MKHAWILVADSARARIFSAVTQGSALKPVEQLVSPESRLHERDLSSDKPGRTFDSAGKGRHATNPGKSPKEQIAIDFAGEVSHFLEQGRVNNKYEKLILVADPKFLGLVTHALSEPAKKLVSLKISKDLSKATVEEIQEHLPAYL